MTIPDSARELIESNALAHMITLNEDGSAPDLLQELAKVYLGPDIKFLPMPDPPPGYITRVKVERISGVGPWGRKV